MNRELRLLSGAGLGAALMYVLDPERGRRRRALLRDKLVSAAGEAPRAIEVTVRDLSNRAQGVAAEAASKLTRDEAPDERIAARIRSKLGRIISHPGAIEVTIDEGRVRLTGNVLADEVDRLFSVIFAVPGIRGVDNRLEVHATSDNVPALQGGKPRRRNPLGFMTKNWPPAVRVLAAGVGVASIIQSLKRKTLTSKILGTVGLGLISRSVINKDMKRLVCVASDAIDIQKAINIDLPVERVFEFWTNYQNYSRFMSNVIEVRDLGDGRSHWVVKGPAGQPVEWDAVITECEPNRLLAWKSVEGSDVDLSGRVRFDKNPDGATRVDVRLSYTPPAGVVGHAVAWLFGSDPKTAMDDDLMRMKSFIETGIEPHDAAAKESSLAHAAMGR